MADTGDRGVMHGTRRWASRMVPAGVSALLVVLVAGASPGLAGNVRVLDDFEELAGWTVQTSPGASLELAHDTGHTGLGLRIDFDFKGGAGYVIIRKAIAVTLPPNFAFSLWIRGDALPNSGELKLVDRSGQNVWWYRRRNYEFPREWQQVFLKKRRFEFAWGPAGGGEPRDISMVEFAIVATSGGRGSVWLDDFALEEREPTARPDAKPKVRASTSAPGAAPDNVLDGNPETVWRSGALAENQWIDVDFVRPREYGGLVIDWDPADYATAYTVQTSADGAHWTTVYTSTAGNGGRDYIYLPDGESRFLRIDLEHSTRGQGYAIRDLGVKPYEFSASPNAFFAAMARDYPRGTFPKYFADEQSYWTVIGVSGDTRRALFNEQGMLEVDGSAFSLEPFLHVNGRFLTWNDVQTVPELERGYLPVPSVVWRAEGLALRITAFAAGPAGASRLYVRYRVDNRGDQHLTGDLFVAVRPFQVSPPWQALNMVGGFTPIRALAFDRHTARVNDAWTVVSLTPPDRAGAALFEEAPVATFLAAGTVPSRAEVSDPSGFASGALQYGFSIPPRGHAEVYLAVPFHETDRAAADLPGPGGPEALFTQQFAATVRQWSDTLDRVDWGLPPEAEDLVRTMRTTVAYILINRVGPAIHPGPRNYARSWIRDGALTSAALLEMGCTAEVRDFLTWYAGYQFPDGKIPCCIDARGADPTPEHDSNGQFLYAVAEYVRYTGDVGFLSTLWPAVVTATEYLETLRQQRLTDEYKRSDRQLFYGLLPQSISHEGYSAHPVHSYWDDFFALRGFADAAALAVAMGDDVRAARYASIRDAFRHDLMVSIERAIATHHIDFVPGAAELGDFDPTSTAVAVAPGNELQNLPAAALQRTFDRYYDIVVQRDRVGPRGDDAYTPYELRNIEVFVRLGQRERAWDLLTRLMAGRRPPAWNQWAELVWRERDAPKFVGDMPHTWVASSLIRSVRAMLVYEREADRSLVIAAGVPAAWLTSSAGVTVRRLATHHGPLHVHLQSEGPHRLRVRLWGDVCVPPGGLVLQPPLPAPLKAVTVNGKAHSAFEPAQATVHEFPADVVLTY